MKSTDGPNRSGGLDLIRYLDVLERAAQAYKEGRLPAARALTEFILPAVSKSKQPDAIRLHALASMYADRADLKMQSAYQWALTASDYINELELEQQKRFEIQRRSLERFAGLYERNEWQIESRRVLPVLGDSAAVVPILFTLRQMMDDLNRMQRYDLAIVVGYRLLEAVSQRRLASYGIDTADPDYGVLSQTPAQILTRMQEATQMGQRRSQLPVKIDLMSGYLLLAALDDALVNGFRWPKVQGLVGLRNNSILGHGFGFIKEESLGRLTGLVDDVLERLGRIESFEPDRVKAIYRPVKAGIEPEQDQR